MKIVQFISLVAIFGLCFSTTQVLGNDTMLTQTPADSIIVSNNVFTPNGDGGDGKIFEVRSSNEDDVVSLKVFNRFGSLVFSTEAKVCRWNGQSSNGQKMADGTYFFVAEVSEMSPKISKRGAVTLR